MSKIPINQEAEENNEDDDNPPVNLLNTIVEEKAAP